MTDDDKVVEFVSAEDRRKISEIDADQAQWNALRERLIEVMATSELSRGGVTSAALRALLEVLQASGMVEANEAKDYVTARLALFR